MGYTHYWRQHRSFTEAEWTALTEYTRKIVDAALREGIMLANMAGETGTDPEINQELIGLNGAEPDDYESFCFLRDGDGFQFCKTRENPYDPVVVTILVAASRIAPGAVEVSSDGGDAALVPQFTDRVTPPEASAVPQA